MDFREMSNKQLAKEIIARKIAIKENEEIVKKGLEELRERNVNDITTSLGMIYSIEESFKTSLDAQKVKDFLGDKIVECEKQIKISQHYAIKPNRN